MVKNILRIGLLGLLAGCAANKEIITETSKNLILPGIEYITEQQLKGIGYGENKIDIKSPYHDDYLVFNNHIFGTRFVNYDNQNLAYFTLFADDIAIIDYNGDGPEELEIFDKPYNPVKGHIGHENLDIRIYEKDNDRYIYNLQDSILKIIIEKYTIGKVSENTIKKFEKAKMAVIVKDTI